MTTFWVSTPFVYGRHLLGMVNEAVAIDYETSSEALLACQVLEESPRPQLCVSMAYCKHLLLSLGSVLAHNGCLICHNFPAKALSHAEGNQVPWTRPRLQV